MRSLALFLVVALAACASTPKRPDGPTGARESEAVKSFPVLRQVPGNALYLAATSRLDHVPTLVRDFLRPLGRVERGADPDAVDREVREELGFSPFNAADLAAAGFAVDRSFAVASTNLLPTFWLPVADAGKVKERIGGLTRGASIIVSEHRGLELSVLKDDDEFVAWTFHDDYLVVHVGITGYERSTNDWLNELLDRKASMAAEADLDWAHGQAGGRGDFLGLVRLPQILTVGRSLDDAESRTPACDARNEAIARAVGRGAVAATIAAGKLDARGFLELAPAAASGLAAHTAPPPETAYAGIAAEAGFSVAAGVDLDWVGSTFKDVAERDCGLVPELVAELDLDEVEDPFRQMLGARPFSAIHAALLGGSAGLSGVDLQAVAFAHVIDEAAARQLLGRAGTAQPASVDGVAAMRLAQPGLAEPIDYTLGGGVLRAGVGRGLLARLAKGGASAGDAPRTVVAFAVRPDKIPDLFSALALLGGREAELFARFLGEYRHLGAVLASERGGLSLTGGFELR